MSQHGGPRPGDAEARIAELVRNLREARSELDALVAGEADAITCASSAARLVRAVQEDLEDRDLVQQRAEELQAAILDALPAHVALLNPAGVIRVVNESWRRLHSERALPGFGVGDDYLAGCAAAWGEAGAEGLEAAAGIRQVLDRELAEFALEYPFHAPAEQRWFRLMATPLSEEGSPGAVVMHVDITHRKLAELTLQSSGSRMAVAQRIAHFGSWELDLRNQADIGASPLKWSDEMYRIAGFEPDSVEVSNELFFQLVHPDDHEPVREAVAQAIRERRTYSIVHRLIRPSGEERIIREVAQVFCDEASGEPRSMIGTAHDITEQRTIELALQRSEREQRQLAQQLEVERARLLAAQRVAKVGSWETDAQSLAVSWSDETHRIFETDPSTFQPTHASFLDLVHPEDRERVARAFEESLESSLPQVLRHRIRLACGRIKHVEERWQPFHDDQGAPMRALGTCRDITEQVEAEMEVRRSAELLRGLADGTPDAVFVKDLEGKYLLFNEAASRFVGKPAREVIGKDDTAIFGPEDVEVVRSSDRAVIASGHELTTEEVLTAAGVTRVYLATKAPYRDGEGNIIGLLGISRDITERRRADDALRQKDALIRIAGHAARLGGWALDAATSSLAWSDETCAIHEVPAGHVATLDEAIAFCVPEHQPDVRSAVEACLHAGTPFDLECELITARGKQVWVRAIGESVRDAVGAIAGLQGALQDISDRKQAEEETRELAERLTTTFESITDAFYTLDREWRFTYVNFEAERQLRRSRDELLGRVLWDEFPGAVGTAFEREYRRAMSSNRTVAFEDFYPPHAQWYDVHVYPSVQGLAVYFRDVTAARRAEEALRASEERFRAYIEQAADAVFVHDIEGRLITVNRQACASLGWSREELLGRNMADIEPDFDLPQAQEKWRAITPGTSLTLETRHQRKDGSVLPVEVSYGCFDLDGARHYLGMARDVTARNEAEARLMEQAALLDAAHEAIIVKDLDDRLIFWNKGAERIYGWSAEEALGKSVAELLGSDPMSVQGGRAALLANGEWHGELVKRTRSGDELIIEARWTLVRDEKGEPKSILAINTDITEKKKLEAQFLRAQRMESIGTLAGGIAHDLNNVFAPIMMSVEMLRDEVSGPDGLSMLDTLQGSAQRGADLVRQVLAFARGVEGERIPVKTSHIMRELLQVVRDTFPKSIDVKFSSRRDLWTVTGDPTQLHQVFMNLCVNARDAMPGGGHITIEMDNILIDETYAAMNPDARPGPHVMVLVADTGMGVPAHLRDRIFEPFFTTKEVGKGTGLGLSTTLAIVRSHGGFISLYSEVGQGSKFKVCLPADTDAVSADGALSERVALPRGKGELILVVDDEEAIRKTVQATLERFGYRVLLASHGAEAVSRYARQPEIALVLTDMAMPVMDGPALIVALRSMNPSLKIIGSSGLSGDPGAGGYSGSGVVRFVSKPYTAETLLMAMRAVLDGDSAG